MLHNIHVGAVLLIINVLQRCVIPVCTKTGKILQVLIT